MFFKIALFTMLSAFSVASFGQQVRTVTGASVVEGQNPVIRVWGVLAGFADVAQTQPYNSCSSLPESGDFEGCNLRRVNLDTSVTVTFNYTATGEGSRFAYAVIPSVVTGGGNDGNPGTVNNVLVKRGQGILTESGQTSIEFTWRELANAIASVNSDTLVADEVNQRFDKNLQARIAFGVAALPDQISSQSPTIFTIYTPDENKGVILDNRESLVDGNYGFYDLALANGDQNFSVKSSTEDGRQTLFQALSVTPSSRELIDPTNAVGLSPRVTRLQLYASRACADANPFTDAEVFEEDLELTQNSGLQATFVDTSFSGGLTNDVTYFVRAATIDESGTISQLMSNDPSTGYCRPGGTFEVVPSEIAGIIADNECFITTATYGTDKAYQVEIFREFRKKILYPSFFGRFLIKAYNTYGPVGATWINKNPGSRQFMKWLLMPFYGFAHLALNHGLAVALLVYAGLFLILIGIVRQIPLKLKRWSH